MNTELILTKDLPNYVPTIEDLQTIFPKLQSPDKVSAMELKVGVQAIIRKQTQWHPMMPQVQSQQLETVGYITFKKFRDNDKLIWIYEGIVKHK